MHLKTSLKLFVLVVLAVGASSIPSSAQTSPGPCAGNSLCSETNDFLATITSFRISTNNVYKQKIIDVTVRFQNRTDRPLVLAYVDKSGVAVDDRGNRSIPWGPNAYRGIGLVYGTTFDPKLIIRPNASGDAQFELVQQGTPQLTGVTYILDLTVSQILPAEGHQFTLGGEFPLHFEGLTNGSASAAPNLAAAANASDALANLKSIFGKKKSVQNVAAAANTAANTIASANINGNTASSNPSPPNATSAAPQTAPSPSATAPRASTTGTTSIKAGAPTSGSAPSQSAQPWTPPSDTGEEKAELKDPLALPVVAKMPDVVGVRLGMSEQEAAQILRGQYPNGQFQPIPAGGIFPTNPKADYGFNILPKNEIATDVVVSLTAPPSRQVVWQVERNARHMHANHANILATLRAKYGKETLAGVENGTVTTDDRSIGMLFWAFDEHGNHLQLPSPQALGQTSYSQIPCSNSNIYGGGPRIPMEENKSQDWCASIVSIVVSFGATEIVENTFTHMLDMKLATRTASAYVAWKREADARAHAADVAQSKKNKPVF